MNTKKVVTRIPPSPTGHLHIGTVRTALFNYLFAKKYGGQVLFRSEDTDKKRSLREYEDEIIAGLNWLGITCDNLDHIIRQSERDDLYQKYLENLIANNRAYLSHEPSKADPEKEVTVVRLRNPNKVITFTDLVRGEISFDTTELGDIVIARSLSDALYHFTVVVDDYEMGVTHVIRGEDHISNTPRQILIQEALGFPRPEYLHLPLILAPDRSKMSKRHGTVAINSYKEAGYLPAAIINYLALLGWNPGTDQELFTLEELITTFDITGIQKSGAVFDLNKFLWFNRQYLQKLTPQDFTDYLQIGNDNFSLNSPDWQRLIPSIMERINTREEFYTDVKNGQYDFILKDSLTYETDLLQWKKDPALEDALPRLQQILILLDKTDFSSAANIKNTLWPYVEEVGKGEVLWPLRAALSGQKYSPDPFTLAYVLGREKTLARIREACDRIGE